MVWLTSKNPETALVQNNKDTLITCTACFPNQHQPSREVKKN
jgi:hypothetical protein